MSDTTRRALERSAWEDHDALMELLALRARANEVDPRRVEAWALLGDPSVVDLHASLSEEAPLPTWSQTYAALGRVRNPEARRRAATRRTRVAVGAHLTSLGVSVALRVALAIARAVVESDSDAPSERFAEDFQQLEAWFEPARRAEVIVHQRRAEELLEDVRRSEGEAVEVSDPERALARAHQVAGAILEASAGDYASMSLAEACPSVFSERPRRPNAPANDRYERLQALFGQWVLFSEE